jgi:hypothetical protein
MWGDKVYNKQAHEKATKQQPSTNTKGKHGKQRPKRQKNSKTATRKKHK